MIELKHITKLYGNFKALDDINLSIKDGEIFGIVGQSGAGKSTLIRCVNMLEPPTPGEVIIDGKDMTKLSKAQLREESLKVAEKIASYSLPVVLMIKEAIKEAFETSLREGLKFENEQFLFSFSLEDQKEGMAAFLEKRAAVFKGR